VAPQLDIPALRGREPLTLRLLDPNGSEASDSLR
jgi:hypothetical protein